MLVSIIIPLYNKEKYIVRAIKSVLAQTYNNFELIVVDDGSTDNGVILVNKFSDYRLRLITQRNGGVSLARNIGVANANGDWVAFLDADDEYEPDFLKDTVLFINKHHGSDLSFVGTNYYIGSRDCTAIEGGIESGIYDYFQLFDNKRSPNSSSTTIVKKALFFEVGGFPIGVKSFEDWITWFKLASAGSFGFLSQPLGIYYSVEGSASSTSAYNSDFFLNSTQVPKTIIEYSKKYCFDNLKKKAAMKCASKFCFDMAFTYSREGQRNAAFKILRYAKLRHFFLLDCKQRLLLFGHLFCPEVIKDKLRKWNK